jgi:putative endonuclease
MYVGMTNDLTKRIYQHQAHALQGFTAKYSVTKLVYFQTTVAVHAALARENGINVGGEKRRMHQLTPVIPAGVI